MTGKLKIAAIRKRVADLQKALGEKAPNAAKVEAIASLLHEETKERVVPRKRKSRKPGPSNDESKTVEVKKKKTETKPKETKK